MGISRGRGCYVYRFLFCVTLRPLYSRMLKTNRHSKVHHQKHDIIYEWLHKWNNFWQEIVCDMNYFLARIIIGSVLAELFNLIKCVFMWSCRKLSRSSGVARVEGDITLTESSNVNNSSGYLSALIALMKIEKQKNHESMLYNIEVNRETTIIKKRILLRKLRSWK